MRAMLSAFIVLASAGAAAADPSYATFDIPGCSSIAVRTVNDGGVIAGECDRSRGFVRAADGTATLFDIAGTTAMDVRDINAAGTIVGNAGGGGFVRTADGTIVSVKVNDAGTTLTAINAGGVALGSYYSFSGRTSGLFFRMPDGSVEVFKSDGGHGASTAAAINASGMVTGFINRKDVPKPYTYANGTFTTFKVPDTFGLWMSSFRIDDDGDVAGIYYDGYTSEFGFVRDADGTVNAFLLEDDACCRPTLGALASVAGERQAVGTAFRKNGHPYGFIHHDDGRIETIDLTTPEERRLTYAADANSAGVVVGTFVTHGGVGHGFIRTP